MALDLKEIGLSESELQDRVVETIADRLMREHIYGYDEDSEEEVRTPTVFARALESKVMESIDGAVEEIAGRNVLPNVGQYIEGFCLQATNQWGEKTGEPKTFVEYLVERAEQYMAEPVDYNGKTKAESRGMSWNKAQTRIAHLIDKHLQYSIEAAMKKALKTANESIVAGLEETVKMKLQEVADGMKVKLTAK